MAVNVSVGLYDAKDAQPEAVMRQMANEGPDGGKRFIVLRLGTDVSIFLPGFDAESVAYARALADALITVITTMEGLVIVAGDRP